jgi:hypothetical protein
MRGKTRKSKSIILLRLMQFCSMQKQLDSIKKEVVQRILIIFERDFDGNNRKFAKEVGCDEKTIRFLFDHNQGMTLNLLFKIARAIKISPSQLLEGLEFKKDE